MSGMPRVIGRGFTIVELLIVIVVIGILVTLSVTTANGTQKRSRTAAIYANAKQLATAVVIYGQSAGSFPNFSMSCFGDAALFPATATIMLRVVGIYARVLLYGTRPVFKARRA